MATSFLEVLNRAFSSLDGAINNSVTTVNVASGEGSNFPSSFDYHLTVGSEIVKVTGRSTDALTVVRGAEGSTPASHSDGDAIHMLITAQHVSDLNTAVNAQENFTALARVSGSTDSNLQDLQDIFHSAGWVSGGGITDDADGTITVAAGIGLIRDIDGALETIFFTDWAEEAGANVNLADNDISYIYVEWTGGTPAVFARTSLSTDYNTKILLAIVQRTGTTLHINATVKHVVGDHANSMIRRLQDTSPYGHTAGAIISATGTRNFGLNAGAFWEGLTEFTTAAFDSSGAGRFTYWYRKVSDSGWNAVATQSAIHQTNYDDNSGSLATLSNNKYGVHWVYLETDDHVDVVYGQGDYSLAQAEDAQAPSGIPEQIAVSGILVGKIILRESTAAFTQIESAFTSTFSGSLATDHGALVGLADDDHTQYLLADGSRALAGAWDMGGQNLTNVDIDSGSIDGAVIGANSAAAGTFAAIVGTTGVFSGVLSVDDTTASTNATTGSIHTDGGLGVALDLFVEGDVTVGLDNAGATNSLIVRNTHADANSNARVTAVVNGADAASDPFFQLSRSSGTDDDWIIGMDNSDSETLKWDYFSGGVGVPGAGSQMKLTTAGLLSVNADGGGSDDPVLLFDDYDDVKELQRFAYTSESAVTKGIVTAEQRDANRDRMVEMGVADWSEDRDGSQHMMLHVQPMMSLLAGGIYQSREIISELQNELAGVKRQLKAIGG